MHINDALKDVPTGILTTVKDQDNTPGAKRELLRRRLNDLLAYEVRKMWRCREIDARISRLSHHDSPAAEREILDLKTARRMIS